MAGGYFFSDVPFMALWGSKYVPFWHPFASGGADPLGISAKTLSFLELVKRGELPNVSFVDPAFDTEGNGTSADDHPLADIRLGEKFIADAYHALAKAGYLDNTVLVVTFDEWGGFYDHVPPLKVADHTNPADVDHTGDGNKPTDGQLIPDYRQLGFRVPAIVVSNLARPRVINEGPFEHTSTLKMIESVFGLKPLTARDTHALDLGLVLRDHPNRHPTDPSVIPTSSQVPGPADGAAAVCSATSVQSVSPPPVRHPHGVPDDGAAAVLPRSGFPSGSGMAELGRQHRKDKDG